MPASQIGAQLWTLRDFTKTPADIATTLSRVKKIGYDAIQISAFGPIDPQELSNILRGEGLTVAATHMSLSRMENDSARVIEEHQLWGCRYIALGEFYSDSLVTRDWIDFAARYNELSKKFDGSGISIGYHNHSHELARFDGKTGLQILLEGLNRSIWFEIDTYWIAHGGGDPAQWIGKVTGRIPCVHLKDMAISSKREQFMAEVGEGNLNWPAVLGACKAAGVQWYLVEQDICYRDPFLSLEISLRNLRAMGLQ